MMRKLGNGSQPFKGGPRLLLSDVSMIGNEDEPTTMPGGASRFLDHNDRAGCGEAQRLDHWRFHLNELHAAGSEASG